VTIAAITVDDVLAMAPELNTVTDPAWIDILAYVNVHDLTKFNYATVPCVPGLNFGNTSEDGQTARMARIYLAAHMGKMLKLGGSAAAGPVTGESVGGVRRSYGLIAQIPGWLASLSTTRYGQLYLEIVGMSLAALPMVI